MYCIDSFFFAKHQLLFSSWLQVSRFSALYLPWQALRKGFAVLTGHLFQSMSSVVLSLLYRCMYAVAGVSGTIWEAIYFLSA